MNTKFKIGQNVYFFSLEVQEVIQFNLFDLSFTDRLERVFCGKIVKIIIESDKDIQYEIQTYDIYGNPSDRYFISESELFEKRSECIKAIITIIKENINKIVKKLNEKLDNLDYKDEKKRNETSI